MQYLVSRWSNLNIELSRDTSSGASRYRDAIASLYATLASLPEPLLQDYSGITEEELTFGLSERAASVARGEVMVEVRGDDIETLLDAARLLRALEACAVEFTRYLESDIGADLEEAWRTTDGNHYVIPRMTSLDTIDGKPFLRRALHHFRVLPTVVNGFGVRLHRHQTARSSAAARLVRSDVPRSYGAALFPNLKAELAFPDDKSFVVSRLSGCDCFAEIEKHLAYAKANRCSGVVWGELTVPQGELAAISDALSENALEGCGALRYLVAGSWHREVDGVFRNVCQVLDGFGEPLFKVLKWAKFEVAGKREAIVPGDEVHVLVDEGELSIVAVCRDFLQATTDVPYLQLDVDLAIVPSMIIRAEDQGTMLGHAATANTMRVRYGTRTLVVAQPAEPAEDVVGQVMDFPAKPLEAQHTDVCGNWHECLLANS